MTITITTTSPEEETRILTYLRELTEADAAAVRAAMKEAVRNEEKPDIVEVIEDYCQRFSLTIVRLRSRHKVRSLSDHRQILMYILSKKFKFHYKKIGEALLRDRTTIRHGVVTVEDLMKTNQIYKERVENALKLY